MCPLLIGSFNKANSENSHSSFNKMDSQTLLATEKDLKQKLKSINQQIEECFEKVNTLFSEQDKQELKSNLSKVEESIKSTIEKLVNYKRRNTLTFIETTESGDF